MFYIRPIKEELISENPPVRWFHDVISKYEIDMLKVLAKSRVCMLHSLLFIIRVLEFIVFRLLFINLLSLLYINIISLPTPYHNVKKMKRGMVNGD